MVTYGNPGVARSFDHGRNGEETRIDGMTFGWVDHFGNKKDILMKHGEKDGLIWLENRMGGCDLWKRS